MKELAKESIRNRDITKITVDEIVNEIIPRGKNSVPEEIKSELLDDVRNFVKRDKFATKWRESAWNVCILHYYVHNFITHVQNMYASVF